MALFLVYLHDIIGFMFKFSSIYCHNIPCCFLCGNCKRFELFSEKFMCRKKSRLGETFHFILCLPHKHFYSVQFDAKNNIWGITEVDSNFCKAGGDCDFYIC